MVISVSRKPRSSERVLKGVMIGCAVLFLLQGILFSTGFMLPCFLMVICYYWYSRSCVREYEYTLADETLRIERVSDAGRRLLHEIPFDQIRLICRPDAPEAAPYRKGGSIRIKKVDYTSYQEDVPYYPGGGPKPPGDSLISAERLWGTPRRGCCRRTHTLAQRSRNRKNVFHRFSGKDAEKHQNGSRKRQKGR